MNRIDRYVVRHIFEMTALVALGLLAIFTFVAFVSDIGDTGQGDYGVLQLLEYTGLMLPNSLYILMPIIGLLGTLLGIGVLSRNSELTAMRAAGTSLVRIGVATLAAGLVLGLVTVFLGDWAAPEGQRAATALRDHARGGGGAHAVWLRDGSTMVQVGDLKKEDQVGDVTLYQVGDDGRLLSVLTAKKGEYQGDHWHLTDVQTTRFSDDHTEVSTAPELDLNGGVNPSVLRLFILEADSLSFTGLLRLIGYLKYNHLDFAKYQLLFWRKLIEPVTVMAMMLFAIPFVLGQMRDTGAGQRLMVGVLVGIVFYVLNRVCLSYGALYTWPPMISAGAPTAVLAAAAMLRLRRAR
jgi:lipopolysaccharide export system permease protein